MEQNVTFNISYEEESLKQNILKDKTRMKNASIFLQETGNYPLTHLRFIHLSAKRNTHKELFFSVNGTLSTN